MARPDLNRLSKDDLIRLVDLIASRASYQITDRDLRFVQWEGSVERTEDAFKESNAASDEESRAFSEALIATLALKHNRSSTEKFDAWVAAIEEHEAAEKKALLLFSLYQYRRKKEKKAQKSMEEALHA